MGHVRNEKHSMSIHVEYLRRPIIVYIIKLLGQTSIILSKTPVYNGSNSLRTYRKFKSNFDTEMYLIKNMAFTLFKCLAVVWYGSVHCEIKWVDMKGCKVKRKCLKCI